MRRWSLRRQHRITVRDKPPMDFGGDHSAPGHGKIVPRCVPKPPAVARYRPDAFPSCRPWQDCALMYPQAAGHGKIVPRCVHEGASDGKNTGSWQYIACMYSNTANFGKICVLCIRKAPQSAVGEYTARTSCRQGAFSPSDALKSCTAHESLPPSGGPAPAQGLRPEQLHRGIAFQRPGPCAGMASHTGRGSRTLLNGLALAQGCLPITVRDKPPMNFGGDHPTHGLQFGQAPRGRRSGVPGWPCAPAPRGPGGCCHRGRSPLRTTDRKLPGPGATAR